MNKLRKMFIGEFRGALNVFTIREKAGGELDIQRQTLTIPVDEAEYMAERFPALTREEKKVAKGLRITEYRPSKK